EDPEELLGLRVRHGQLDRLVAGRLSDALGLARSLRSIEDEDVAQNDARDLLVLDSGQLPGADHVDVVTGRQRPDEKLVRVAGDLERAEVSGDLRPDALLLLGAEAQERDLLAGVDRLRGDLAREILRLHDRAWGNSGLRHLGTRELSGDVVSGRT